MRTCIGRASVVCSSMLPGYPDFVTSYTRLLPWRGNLCSHLRIRRYELRTRPVADSGDQGKPVSPRGSPEHMSVDNRIPKPQASPLITGSTAMDQASTLAPVPMACT